MHLPGFEHTPSRSWSSSVNTQPLNLNCYTTAAYISLVLNIISTPGLFLSGIIHSKEVIHVLTALQTPGLPAQVPKFWIQPSGAGNAFPDQTGLDRGGSLAADSCTLLVRPVTSSIYCHMKLESAAAIFCPMSVCSH